MDQLLSCSTPDLIRILLALVAYSLIEFWLGKTKRLKASSAIELSLALLLLVASWVLKPKEKKDDRNGNNPG